MYGKFGISVLPVFSCGFLVETLRPTMLAAATILTMFLGQGPVPFSYGLDQSIPCPRGSNQDSVCLPMVIVIYYIPS